MWLREKAELVTIEYGKEDGRWKNGGDELSALICLA